MSSHKSSLDGVYKTDKLYFFYEEERMQSTEPTTQTSSGQHVLQPNRAPSTRNQQTIFVEVSSRDRNYLQRVQSNPIRYQFARPLKDVQSVELVSGTIPAQPYNIVNGANAFTFREHNGNSYKDYEITIPPGRYTPITLIAQLTAIFMDIGITNTYTWCVCDCTWRVTLKRESGNQPFELLFMSGLRPDEIDRSDGQFLKQNTPATILGFDLSDYGSGDTDSIVSPFPLDLNSSLNRIYLYINFDNKQDLGAIERGAGRRWPFALIYMDSETCGYKYLNKETFTPVSFSLPQPWARLQNLEIEFRDEWYRIVDFNGKDFSLLLQITVLE